MLIAQITDTHLLDAAPDVLHGRVRPHDALVAVVDHLVGLDPPVAAVVWTGDLADTGAPGAYAQLRAQMARLDCVHCVSPGNHDSRPALRAAFPHQPWPDQPSGATDATGRLHGVWRVGGWRVIGLDSTLPGRSEGALAAEDLAWLERTLAQEPEAPCLVVLHHPPFATGIPHMDAMALQDPGPLMEILAAAAQVRHLACGHVHRAVTAEVRGLGCSVAPSPALAVAFDPSPQGRPAFTLEPPMLRLFSCAPDGGIATHLVPLTAEGPFPFPFA